MKNILGILVFILFFVPQLWAETLYLKNGRKIQGQIFEKNDKKVKIQVQGVTSTYYADEIERIENTPSGTLPAAIKPVTSPPLNQQLNPLPSSSVPRNLPAHSPSSAAGTFRDNPTVMSMSKLQLIMRYMELSGQKDNLNQTLADVITKAPSDEKEKIRNLFKTDEILSQLVPVYDRNFSLEELRDLVAFYESPVSKKLQKISATVTQEVMEATMQYFQNKLQNLEPPQGPK